MVKKGLTTLRNKIQVKHGFSFKGKYFSSEGKYIVLTPGNFYETGGFKFELEKAKFYSGNIPSEYICKKDDLIVAMTEQAEGLLGSSAIVPESDRFLHNQRIGLVLVDKNEVDKSFLYHLFNTKSVRQQLRRSSSGSKVKHTSPNRIYDLVVNLPPLPIQKKIVAVLSALDSKIQLNNRINAELEAIAKSLYDFWFIQFDFPNKKGKPYKTNSGKMVWNSNLKREIPLMWEDGKISNIVNNIRESTNAEQNPHLPYIPIDKLPMKKLVSADSSPHCEAKSSLVLFKKNDILLGAMRVYFHRVCLAIQKGITRTTTFVLRPKDDCLKYYSLFTINTNESIGFAKVNSKGTTMPYTFWEKGYENFKVVIPPKEYLLSFNKIIEPILEKSIANELETKSLAELRDWLLPMLMNEQVKVK